MGDRIESESKNVGMTRRDFLMTALGAAAGVATGKNSEKIFPTEERHQETVGRIVAFSTKKEELIPKGAGLDNFFYGSGWDKEGYSRESYHDALKLVNRETHPETNIDALQENAGITILVKADKEKE